VFQSVDLTSTGHVPVKAVGSGKIGPVTRRIWDGYWNMHYDERYSFEVKYDVAEKEAQIPAKL